MFILIYNSTQEKCHLGGKTVSNVVQVCRGMNTQEMRYSFNNELESKIMLCGGHVGKAHGKKLQEFQGMSTFTSAFIAIHKEKFPDDKSVKCCCIGKKHVYVATRNKSVCGCIGPGFMQSAKQNHYCALVHAGKDPEKYRETMLALGRYHCRDIHEWEGGSCSFHPLTKCSCMECKPDEQGFYGELKCLRTSTLTRNITRRQQTLGLFKQA